MNTAKPVLLDSTAREINDAHRMARQHAESAVQYAICCGELLTQQKAKLRHGEFKPWIEANCEFSYRSAAVYMKVAEQKCRGLHFSSLAQALSYANEKPAPPEPEPEPEPEPASVAEAEAPRANDFADRLAAEIKAPRELEHMLADMRQNLDPNSRAVNAWQDIHTGAKILRRAIDKARNLPACPISTRVELGEAWDAIRHVIRVFVDPATDRCEHPAPEPEAEPAVSLVMKRDTNMLTQDEMRMHARVQAELQIMLDQYNALADKYKDTIAAYKGVFSRTEYKSLLGLLHTDRLQGLDDEQRANHAGHFGRPGG